MYQYLRVTAPRSCHCYDAGPMEPENDRVRDRIAPALLTALGVTFLAAGLLTWTTPAEAGPPAASPLASNGPSPTPIGPGVTLPPLGTAEPGAASPDVLIVEPSDTRLATRVRIAALKIDLPVVEPPGGANDYPLCNVAMYFEHESLGQPGSGRATYLYAHARKGMFLPLLETKASRQRGMVAEVWTNDDLRFLYEIAEVRRDQRTLTDALEADTEQLWLQTSEGPRGTPGKTQVVATFLSVERADHAAANPKPRPVDCS
jgi:hypothetical protein